MKDAPTVEDAHALLEGHRLRAAVLVGRVDRRAGVQQQLHRSAQEKDITPVKLMIDFSRLVQPWKAATCSAAQPSAWRDCTPTWPSFNARTSMLHEIHVADSDDHLHFVDNPNISLCEW